MELECAPGVFYNLNPIHFLVLETLLVHAPVLVGH